VTWPVVPLRDLICLADSGTWGDEAPEGAGFPVLRSSNIQGGRLDLSEVAWRLIPEANTARRLLQSGDLLITKSSGSPDLIGKCCQFTQPEGGTKFYFSNFTLRLRADHNRADSRWLFFWLSSPRGRAVLAAMNTTTSGLRNLNIGLYLSQLVPAPPVTEQRRIAAVLDKADTIRRKRQQALQLTDELLHSAFLDIFGDPITNPKGWGSDLLGNRLTFLTSGSRGWADYYSKSGRLFLRIQNVGRNRMLLDDVAYVQPPDTTEAQRTLVRPGDVLLSITADLGRTAVVPEGLGPAHINQHLALLRPTSVEPVYLAAYLASAGGQTQLLKRNRQGVKAGLNFDDIRSLRVLLPPRERQQSFAEFQRSVEKLKTRYADVTEETQQLFHSLVQRAFCGELDYGTASGALRSGRVG